MLGSSISTSSSAGSLNALLAALGAWLGILFILSLAVAVVSIIAGWKIFEKAGEKGWKVLIPFYNTYILYKVFWKKELFWVVLGVSFGVSFIAGFLTGLSGSSEPTLTASFLTFAVEIFELVMTIILLHRISRSFGHGGGFTCGLVFLTPIFWAILGFNNDKYKKIKD